MHSSDLNNELSLNWAIVFKFCQAAMQYDGASEILVFQIFYILSKPALVWCVKFYLTTFRVDCCRESWLIAQTHIIVRQRWNLHIFRNLEVAPHREEELCPVEPQKISEGGLRESAFRSNHTARFAKLIKFFFQHFDVNFTVSRTATANCYFAGIVNHDG